MNPIGPARKSREKPVHSGMKGVNSMIKAENLTKSFGDFMALSSITCTIPQGCIYGMVGSNGAGKSTFLRLVTGVYKADKGQVSIDGVSVFDIRR